MWFGGLQREGICQGTPNESMVSFPASYLRAMTISKLSPLFIVHIFCIFHVNIFVVADGDPVDG